MRGETNPVASTLQAATDVSVSDCDYSLIGVDCFSQILICHVCATLGAASLLNSYEQMFVSFVDLWKRS